ncbi:MAG: hypothetical protein FWE86_05515 [Oscillospiraceae bacterium]|nr:hypothetical protein [Oscillospiraceae bacterium]
MTSFEISLAVTALAEAIAAAVPDDSLDLIGAAITQLGDTLTTISVSRARIQIKDSPPSQYDQS